MMLIWGLYSVKMKHTEKEEKNKEQKRCWNINTKIQIIFYLLNRQDRSF